MLPLQTNHTNNADGRALNSAAICIS